MATKVQKIVEAIISFKDESKNTCNSCGSPWQLFELDHYDDDDSNFIEAIKLAHKILKSIDNRVQELNSMTIQLIVDDLRRTMKNG